MVIAPCAPPLPAIVEESALANEVWRSRGALARHAAAELREQTRVGLWVARRHTAYTRWLLGQARCHLGALDGGGAG
ncbi:MAG: hypothetical protein JO306_11125 [Gemmatimonadetes bacterium]|nr:hypothetical protein [Gemmatimonadota bacterium]